MYYCGAKKIPKGKKRGSPKYCAQTNQVRYYGVEKINKKYLDIKKVPDMQKEEIKLRKLYEDAKILIKEFSLVKKIIDENLGRPTKIKQAEKRRVELLKKRDNLKKRLANQTKVVDALKKNQKKEKKVIDNEINKYLDGLTEKQFWALADVMKN